MAKKKTNREKLIEENDRRSFEPPKDGRIVIPSGDRRHTTKIREGTLDTTVAFSKRRLATLPVDED